MKAMTLQAVTWTTVAGVVGSALWLAAVQPSMDGAPQARSRNGLTNLNMGDTQARAMVPAAVRTEARAHRKAEPVLQLQVAELAPAAR